MGWQLCWPGLPTFRGAGGVEASTAGEDGRASFELSPFSGFLFFPSFPPLPFFLQSKRTNNWGNWGQFVKVEAIMSCLKVGRQLTTGLSVVLSSSECQPHCTSTHDSLVPIHPSWEGKHHIERAVQSGKRKCQEMPVILTFYSSHCNEWST